MNTMDIQAFKLTLIEKLLRVSDESILRKVESFIDENKEEVWDLLSEGEKEAFEEGVKDFEAGRIISLEDANKELYKKYPELAP